MVEIIEQFNSIFHKSRIWTTTTWFGIPILKNPMDCWIYQEIIFNEKPDVIIETGTANGGCSLFLAHLCELIGNGRVFTIDIEENLEERDHSGDTIDEVPNHKRITYYIGSSVDEKTLSDLNDFIKPNEKVMVILDSDHSKEYIKKEISIYNKLVTKNQYLIVEDTNLPGPRRAVKEFLSENKEFEIDEKMERFLVTFNKNGVLKKV